MTKLTSYLVGVVVVVGLLFASCSSDNNDDNGNGNGNGGGQNVNVEQEIKEIKEKLYGYWEFGKGEIKSVKFNENDTYKLTKRDLTVLEDDFKVTRNVDVKASLNLGDYTIVLKNFGNISIKSIDKKKIVIVNNGAESEGEQTEEPDEPDEPDDPTIDKPYKLGFILFGERKVGDNHISGGIMLYDEDGNLIEKVYEFDTPKSDVIVDYYLAGYNNEEETVYYTEDFDFEEDGYETNIYAMNIRTKEPQLLKSAKFPRGQYMGEIYVTDDGKYIYYIEKHIGDNWSFNRFDIAENKSVKLFEPEYDKIYANSSCSLIVEAKNQSYRIYKNNGKLELLDTWDKEGYYIEDVSPDGKQLMLTSDFDDKEFFISDIYGKNMKSYTVKGDASQPYVEAMMFSCDQKYIYFDQVIYGQYDSEGYLESPIYSYNIETGEEKKMIFACDWASRLQMHSIKLYE